MKNIHTKKRFAVILALVIIAAATLSSSVGATPGDINDPLVSRSYVDEKFNQLLTIISAMNDTLNLNHPIMPDPVDSIVVAESPKFVPVNAFAGQLLIGSDSTEIILRSGKAVGYTLVANGLTNITSGTEVLNGTDIPTNNLLIVPRDDGRGALVVEDAWFMVRGDYTLH